MSSFTPSKPADLRHVTAERLSAANGCQSLRPFSWVAPIEPEYLQGVSVRRAFGGMYQIDASDLVYTFDVEGSTGACMLPQTAIPIILEAFHVPGADTVLSQSASVHAACEYSVRKFLWLIAKFWCLGQIEVATAISRMSAQDLAVTEMECVIVDFVTASGATFSGAVAIPERVQEIIEAEAWPQFLWTDQARVKGVEEIKFRVLLCSLSLEPTSLIELLQPGTFLEVPVDLAQHSVTFEADLGVNCSGHILWDGSNVWLNIADERQSQQSGDTAGTTVDVILAQRAVSSDFFRRFPKVIPLESCLFPEIRLSVGGETVATATYGYKDGNPGCYLL